MEKWHSTIYIKNWWVKEGDVDISNEEWFKMYEFQGKSTNSYLWREFC